MALDCLAAGSCAFDVLMSVPHPPGSDQRVAASALTSGGGGPAATAAAAMAKLGRLVELVSAVGDDVFGHLIRAELNSQGVGTAGIQTVPNQASTVSSVLVEPSGHRAMSVYTGCMSRVDLGAIDRSRISAARIVHLDGNNPLLAEAVARDARRQGIPVSLDGGNIAADVLDRLLPLVDLYVPDEASVARHIGALAPRDACHALHARGPALVCITRAEHGSIALANGTLCEVPSLAGIAIVDTTGAGDNFHGAFLHAWLAGWDLEATLAFANSFAALCCRAVGGRASVPDETETLDHLARGFGIQPGPARH